MSGSENVYIAKYNYRYHEKPVPCFCTFERGIWLKFHGKKTGKTIEADHKFFPLKRDI